MVTNRLTGQNGMSLIEMLIVTGILSFISLVIASTFGDIFKLQSQVVARDETNEIAASIGRYMFSESTCTAALGGQLFPVAAGATTKIQLPDYMGVGASANGVDIKDGSYISPKIRVHELSLRNKGMAPHDTLSESKIYKRYVGQITLKLEANLDSKWVPSSPRNFELPLLVDPLNSRINRCYMEMKVSDTCQLMGSTFDLTTGKCMPSTQCLFEGHYTTQTCDIVASCPKGLDNELTGGASCPSVGSSKETGAYNWSFTESCGKKCTQTVNVTTRYHVCLKCN